MKKLNIIMTIICVILILVNLYIHYDISEYKRNTPNYGSANSGIGVAMIFMMSWAINSIISGILFLITIIAGFKTKRITNLYTLLTIGLIILTFCIPFLLVGVFD